MKRREKIANPEAMGIVVHAPFDGHVTPFRVRLNRKVRERQLLLLLEKLRRPGGT